MLFHPRLWDLLDKTARGQSSSQEERDRVLQEAGENQDSFDLIVATLASSKEAAAGQEQLEFLAMWHGEARANELVAAARNLDERHHDYLRAKWELSRLIQEQVHARRDTDAGL
ncbi:MAG: hypothetical protein AB7K24_33930 [Gemmataceae bacterium]